MKYVFFLLVLTTFLSCNNLSNTNSCNKTFVFEFPIKVEGLRDTISLNDTIFYQLTIPNETRELNSNHILNITSAELNGFEVSFKNLDTVRNDTEQLFQYISQVGKANLLTNGIFSQISLEFETTETGRQVNFGIIPKEVGVYYVSTGVLLQEHESGPVVIEDEMCNTKTTNVIFPLEDAENINNFYLLENSLITEYTDAPQSELIKNGGFAFVVVE